MRRIVDEIMASVRDKVALDATRRMLERASTACRVTGYGRCLSRCPGVSRSFEPPTLDTAISPPPRLDVVALPGPRSPIAVGPPALAIGAVGVPTGGRMSATPDVLSIVPA